MKESYYTLKTIDSRAREFARLLDRQRGRHFRPLCADQSALLILDMQKFFLLPQSHAFVPSATALLPRLQALQHLAIQQQLPLIHTCHLNTAQDANQMAHWWRDLLQREDPLSHLVPEIKREEAIYIEKKQYDGFYQTDLENILKSRGISQVIIGGVMTHLCCETTARSAFVRGFEVFFLIDGTATYNAEFHLATLQNLAHGFGQTVLVEEVVSFLEKGSQ